MLDTSELDIGNINPFRYRSYYYDTETGWYYLNSRYYNSLLCRFITMDSVEYLGGSGSMLSLNLYAYCEYNPVMNVDPDGHFAWWLLMFVVGACAVMLDGHRTYEPDSDINENNIDINRDNPDGNIKVFIDEKSIQIVDSYKYNNKKDKEKIIEIIMNSKQYQLYNYNRTKESYLSEWDAHNFAYSWFKNSDWGERTRSVDLNKNIKEDKFRWIYLIFR